MNTDTPILIAYDGSPDARAAIDHAAGLMPGAHAVILYARQPLESVAAHLDGHPALEELEQFDAATDDAAARIATEGAKHARDAGLRAEPRVSSTMSTASEAIVDAADELDASLIVIGSRGRRGVRATLLGSTSASVLHHASRPILVIPSAQVARARRTTTE
ncbi:universal stress protein [Mycolicibacterium litorale]|nr:universal stress protein [Mycolicibacterium litorale]